MFAPALGFPVAEPTPHLIPGAIKKTTVLIIIIIFPRGWTITSLPFASAAAIYAARGRIGHAVAARRAAPIGTAAVVIIIVGHVSFLYRLPGRFPAKYGRGDPQHNWKDGRFYRRQKTPGHHPDVFG